jgi:hypothetical protein
VSVADRFIAELAPVASGQVPKDLDMKYENLVKGIQHLKLKVNIQKQFMFRFVLKQRLLGLAH